MILMSSGVVRIKVGSCMKYHSTLIKSMQWPQLLGTLLSWASSASSLPLIIPHQHSDICS